MQVAKPKKGYKLVKTLFGKYEIPEEWEHKELDTISKIVGGGTPDTTKNEYWDGDIPWAVPTDITNLDRNYIENTQRKITKEGLDKSSSKLLPKNSILLTTRATIGYCAICTKPMATNQGFQNVICNSNADNLFILYALRFNKNLLVSLANGTTFAEISKRNVSSVKIAIPPLPEQKQIASILSNVDDTLQKTNQIIEQTQRLKKGIMQKLLTRGIGHKKFKKVKWMFGKEIEIPEEWEVVRINQIIKNKKDIRTGPFGSSLKKDSYTSSGFKIYGQENVIPDNFDIGNYYISAEKFDKMKQYEIKSGDILISLVGTHSKISLVPDNIERGIINPRLLKITFDKSKIFPQFMKIFLNSNLITEQIISFSHGSTMDILNTEIIKQLNFLLIDHEEQKQIASILSNVDTQIQKEKLHKSNLERLKKGLMQKLLTGQIRVKVR